MFVFRDRTDIEFGDALCNNGGNMKNLNCKNIEIKPYNDGFLVLGLKHCNVRDIMESGQYHFWHKAEDDFYVTQKGMHIAKMRSVDDGIEIQNSTEEEIRAVWLPWFDVFEDYDEIFSELEFDKYCLEGIKMADGLRILKQDSYETILQFILSANNNMKRIHLSLRKMSERYGELVGEVDGEKYYSLPSAEVLSKVSVDELKEHCSVGYRNKALVDFANDIVNERFVVEEAEKMSDDELFSYLLNLYGVGDKVAQCIMLFGFHRWSAFPVDVWIDKIMNALYPDELSEYAKTKNLKKITRLLIKDFGKERFGKYAGFAQQLLFVYAREIKK